MTTLMPHLVEDMLIECFGVLLLNLFLFGLYLVSMLSIFIGVLCGMGVIAAGVYYEYHKFKVRTDAEYVAAAKWRRRDNIKRWKMFKRAVVSPLKKLRSRKYRVAVTNAEDEVEDVPKVVSAMAPIDITISKVKPSARNFPPTDTRGIMTNNSRAGTRAPKIVPLSSIIDTNDSYIQPQSDNYTSMQAASFIDPEILEEILTKTLDGESKLLESIENLGKMIDQTKSITNSRLRSAKRVKNYQQKEDQIDSSRGNEAEDGEYEGELNRSVIIRSRRRHKRGHKSKPSNQVYELPPVKLGSKGPGESINGDVTFSRQDEEEELDDEQRRILGLLPEEVDPHKHDHGTHYMKKLVPKLVSPVKQKEMPPQYPLWH